MPRCLIIGYGNPLRGDDRLGWRACEVLAATPQIGQNPAVEIETCHQLTPELAEPISQVDLVIFIDATSEGAPGTVLCEVLSTDESPEAAQAEPTGAKSLGHHFTPTLTLAYARAIFGGNPHAAVISVAAASFALGERLSPEVDRALPEVVAHVKALLTRFSVIY